MHILFISRLLIGVAAFFLLLNLQALPPLTDGWVEFNFKQIGNKSYRRLHWTVDLGEGRQLDPSRGRGRSVYYIFTFRGLQPPFLTWCRLFWNEVFLRFKNPSISWSFWCRYIDRSDISDSLFKLSYRLNSRVKNFMVAKKMCIKTKVTGTKCQNIWFNETFFLVFSTIGALVS